MYEQGVNQNGLTIRSMYVKRERVDLDASHDGKTRQEFADECDINVLLASYERSGVLNHYNSAEPAYFDVSNVPDLQESLDIVARAESAFMTLPAKVRAEFENDPVQFVKYAEDPANLEQMRAWKLAKPAEEPAKPVQVEVMNPAPAPDSK